MKKPYEAHELLYRNMRTKGLRCWEELNAKNEHHDGIEVYQERFMEDALAMPWAPKGGVAIELGCGTGPILRWLGKRGFRGVGVDISRTAITMAREQTKITGLRFIHGDVCTIGSKMAGSFDLAVDGHCLHCLSLPKDRKAFLRNAFRLLRPGGLLLISTMCRPIDRKEFLSKHRERLVGGVLFAPAKLAEEYEGSRIIKGKMHMPTRYIGHWKSITAEVKQAGFRTQLIRLSLHAPGYPISSLCIGALVPATDAGAGLR